MADLVAHIEPEGEPLSEEVLQATPKVPREGGLVAVGSGLQQIRTQLSGLIVVAQRNFLPRASHSCSHIRHPFLAKGGKVTDIVGRERKIGWRC